MPFPACEGSGPWDIDDSCIQTVWSACIPALLAITFSLTLIPVSPPAYVSRAWDHLKAPLQVPITLEDAEADVSQFPPSSVPGVLEGHAAPTWRNTLLIWISLLQVFIWASRAIYESVRNEGNFQFAFYYMVICITWLYNALRPAIYPKATAYIDLFILYIAHLVFGVIALGSSLYHFYAYATPVHTLQWTEMTTNVVIIIAGLWVISNMPLKIPLDAIKHDVYVSRSPEDYASIFEWATYSWVYPLVKRGSTIDMDEGSVWDLSPAMQSRPVFNKFRTIQQPTLLRRLIVANSRDLILDVLLTFVTVLFSYAAPYFLRNILDLINDPTPEHHSRAYVQAFLACFCALMKGEADAQHLFFGRRASARVRVQLMDAIYDKALKRRDFSGFVNKDAATTADDTDKLDAPKPNANVGKAVNLMTIDANKVSMIVGSAYLLYGGPLEITLALILLFSLLGYAAFAGLIVIFIGWALHSYFTRIGIQIQKKLSIARDHRISVLNELIKAVKDIKFFAWEDRWIGRVLATRETEMQWMKKTCINAIWSSLVWASAPMLVSVTSFLVYVYNGNQLTASVAFTSIALMGMLRQPLNILPSFIVQVFQTRVSLERIEAFLNEEEVSEQVSSLKATHPGSGGTNREKNLSIERGYFKWEAGLDSDEQLELNGNLNAEMPASIEGIEDGAGATSGEEIILQRTSSHFLLRDISIQFPEEKLSVITGPTGSGKTALLLALLGEMTKIQGTLNLSKCTYPPTVSYAAQTPWLQRRTIKENIVFGYPYDEQRYNDVVECCALRPDLDILEDGDATQIGDRGINLSGGQRARVALARAVYADTKYVLLDDPFSAVDNVIRRHLVEKLFCGPLLKNRTVILVTHHFDLIRFKASYVVHMRDGRIDKQSDVLDSSNHSRFPRQDLMIEGQRRENESRRNEGRPPPISHIQDEIVERGGIKLSTYMTYLGASGYWMWCIFALFIICSQVMGVVEKLWIREWNHVYGKDLTATASSVLAGNEVRWSDKLVVDFNAGYWLNVVTLPDVRDQPLFYVGVYAAIGSFTALLSVGSSIMQYTAALRASRSLFNRLLGSVVHATMYWHDITPNGRLLNRFSKDMDAIDSTLSNTMATVSTSLVAFGVAVLTVAVFFPAFLVPATFIALLYRFIATRYLAISRQLRRMESTSRSPIFSGFGELLEGIITIRAFAAEERFMEEFHKNVDIATKMYYNSWMTNRWLLFNFDVLGALAVLMTTLLALSEYVRAGTAGLCITSAMSFTMSVYLTCRSWTALELDLNAVERVAEYLEIPQEPIATLESSKLPAYWPSSTKGQVLISVENLSVSYAPELPLVLHNISFTLNGGERIGILGRSGSGKSTLVMSMLRFVDPMEGRIVIDGIDISTIGVHDLRSHVAYIPENPVLFSGTLRENIDPLAEHYDDECEDVLRRVQLLCESVHESQGGSRSSSPGEVDGGSRPTIALDTEVAPGGVNFSQGQRQLIAMARTLLRRCRIVILDEATSSIDFDTDAKIQATIRDHFAESLLITITHRLAAIFDYDRLIVLENGRVSEIDTPSNLRRKEGGIFRTMYRSGTIDRLNEKPN
ncbi:hypothetical protein V8B97DRAFT_1983434 [Scleroderma yunnanense]